MANCRISPQHAKLPQLPLLLRSFKRRNKPLDNRFEQPRRRLRLITILGKLTQAVENVFPIRLVTLESHRRKPTSTSQGVAAELQGTAIWQWSHLV
jgi:DTW domain-containing protein YfiP